MCTDSYISLKRSVRKYAYRYHSCTTIVCATIGSARCSSIPIVGTIGCDNTLYFALCFRSREPFMHHLIFVVRACERRVIYVLLFVVRCRRHYVYYDCTAVALYSYNGTLVFAFTDVCYRASVAIRTLLVPGTCMCNNSSK